MTKSASTIARAKVPARPRARSSGASAPAHTVWTSRAAFVAVSAGAVIWLNNLSQFPYFVDRYGGSAFLLAYFACLLLIGLPVMITEFLLGRLGAASPPLAIARIAQESGAHRRWAVIGVIAMAAGFLVFCYYSVFAGWTLAHLVRAGAGAFKGLTLDGVGSLFAAFVRDPEKQLFWHALFTVVVVFILARGPRLGIERAIQFLLPALVFALLVLLFYSAALGALPQALQRMLSMDLTQLSGEALLAAAGQAFFGLSLGLGALMAYGAYAPPDARLARVSWQVIGIDAAVGAISTIITLAVLYAGAVPLASGSELLFQAMPVAFDHLPGGRVMGTLFFAALALIAVMSGIALLEPLVMWLVDRRGYVREKAALTVGAAAWLVGVAVILSFSHWSFSFSFLDQERRFGLFDALLIGTSNLLLPLGVIALLLFAGWRIKSTRLAAQFQATSPCVFELYVWSVRALAPLLILLLAFNVHKLFL